MTICLNLDKEKYHGGQKIYIHNPPSVKLSAFGDLTINSRKPIIVNLIDVEYVDKLIRKRRSFTYIVLCY